MFQSLQRYSRNCTTSSIRFFAYYYMHVKFTLNFKSITIDGYPCVRKYIELSWHFNWKIGSSNRYISITTASIKANKVPLTSQGFVDLWKILCYFNINVEVEVTLQIVICKIKSRKSYFLKEVLCRWNHNLILLLSFAWYIVFQTVILVRGPYERIQKFYIHEKNHSTRNWSNKNSFLFPLNDG